jgi:hypothetical protein
MVQYSSNTGNTWATVQSTSPASLSYISLTGPGGSLLPQTLKVYGLNLAYSTRTAVCNGVVPCASTNQIKFYVPDRAGNMTVAGPYSILVDTVPTAAITDLTSLAIYSSSVTLAWTAPADSGSGVGAVTTGWYRLDYSTYTGYTFSSTTFKVEIATLAAIGATQTISLDGLCPYTTYYFSVYAGDRAYNFSLPSNIPTVQPLVAAADCGLRTYDGAAVVRLACRQSPPPDLRLRVFSHGSVYGVILLDVNSPCGVSRMRIQTPEGMKAVKKY